jgi:hypothetical protein
VVEGGGAVVGGMGLDKERTSKRIRTFLVACFSSDGG